AAREPLLGQVPPAQVVLVQSPAQVIDDAVLSAGVEVDQPCTGIAQDDVAVVDLGQRLLDSDRRLTSGFAVTIALGAGGRVHGTPHGGDQLAQAGQVGAAPL